MRGCRVNNSARGSSLIPFSVPSLQNTDARVALSNHVDHESAGKTSEQNPALITGSKPATFRPCHWFVSAWVPGHERRREEEEEKKTLYSKVFSI